jgi:hypothetical protein
MSKDHETQRIQQNLQKLAEQEVPAEEVDLLPAIHAQLEAEQAAKTHADAEQPAAHPPTPRSWWQRLFAHLFAR